MLQNKMKRQSDGDQVLAMQIKKISQMKGQLEEYRNKHERSISNGELLRQKLDKYSKMDQVIHGTMTSAKQGTGNVEVMNEILIKELQQLKSLIRQQRDIKEQRRLEQATKQQDIMSNLKNDTNLTL